MYYADTIYLWVRTLIQDTEGTIFLNYLKLSLTIFLPCSSNLLSGDNSCIAHLTIIRYMFGKGMNVRGLLQLEGIIIYFPLLSHLKYCSFSASQLL